MPIFCCGFNEFGQVSSADSDRQRGFVPLPMVMDMQSKIRTCSSLAQAQSLFWYN